VTKFGRSLARQEVPVVRIVVVLLAFLTDSLGLMVSIRKSNGGGKSRKCKKNEFFSRLWLAELGFHYIMVVKAL
jgi:hypothetical protein